MAELHERHAAEGFELDEDPATVAAFRRGRQPMPWTHAWDEPETAEKLCVLYQGAGSTKTIVVVEPAWWSRSTYTRANRSSRRGSSRR